MKNALLVISAALAGCSSFDYPCAMPRFAVANSTVVHDTLSCPAGGPREFTARAGSADLRVSIVDHDKLWMAAHDGDGRALDIRGSRVGRMPSARFEQAMDFTHWTTLEPSGTEIALELVAPEGSEVVPIVLRFERAACTCRGYDSL